jgi:hypothetical protein
MRENERVLLLENKTGFKTIHVIKRKMECSCCEMGEKGTIHSVFKITFLGR